MSANNEKVDHGAVDRKESLCLSRRLESSHLAFPLPRTLMRYLGPVVGILIVAVQHRWHHIAFSGRVALELVCDQLPANGFLSFQKFPEKSFGCVFVASALHKNVDNFPILINSPP